MTGDRPPPRKRSRRRRSGPKLGNHQNGTAAASPGGDATTKDQRAPLEVRNDPDTGINAAIQAGLDASADPDASQSPGQDAGSEPVTVTVTGIVDYPHPSEGRIRQLGDAALIEAQDDPLVPQHLAEQYALRPGLEVTVTVSDKMPRRKRSRNRRGKRPQESRAPRPVVEEVLSIEGLPPENFSKTRPFEDLTSVDPEPRMTLEYDGCPASCRLIDLFCPIGRGQRGLIVSPPKAGKTTLLKDITKGILINHPETHVFVLLVDERPEEVTDFKRSFTRPDREGNWTHPWDQDRIQVIASSNDHDIHRHIAVCTMTIERCKRMVEAGKHVVVIMDSITRMSRAFNNSRKHANSGRTMSGGIDSKALEVPKQIFGSARNTEEAGSLTILASCLVDTGSQGDQVIFEEFKGTGNMELILDRAVAERRLFPAMNLAASGTRKEDKLMDAQELATITALRRRMLSMPPHQQIEQLLVAMKRFPRNAALVGTTATPASTPAATQAPASAAAS